MPLPATPAGGTALDKCQAALGASQEALGAAEAARDAAVLARDDALGQVTALTAQLADCIATGEAASAVTLAKFRAAVQEAYTSLAAALAPLE